MCFAAIALVLTGCGGGSAVEADEVSRAFEGQGLSLSDVPLFPSDDDPIKSAFFGTDPSGHTFFVTVFEEERDAETSAVPAGSPDPAATNVVRRRNVVAYLPDELDPAVRERVESALDAIS
jgi:hypothetical protein